MSLPRSWSFVLVGFLCVTLAVSGILMNSPPTWGLLEIALYLILVTLGVAGILRLIYLRGLPE
jgi:predicted membrane channel-forming protein YqfA (hemolysin III family)